MKAARKVLLVTCLVTLLVFALAGQALADTGSQVRPDVGPSVPGLVAGQDGYKVFGPDAIKTAPLEATGQNSMAPLVENRTAISDIWKTGDTFYGSHDSESPLYEDEIRAQGGIKWDIHQGWDNTCDSGESSGYQAQCNTSMADPNIWWKDDGFIAHTYHHFHKSGYVDWDPETQDFMRG